MGGRQYFIDMLRSILPSRWFGDSTPVLDSVLSGLAAAWEQLYSALNFVRTQSRLTTAYGIWLDLIGEDFFGAALRRRHWEIDTTYRDRLLAEIGRERGTRAALKSAIEAATSTPCRIFEPARPQDTGGYGALPGRQAIPGGNLAYGAMGGWGCLKMPFQVLVDTRLKISSGSTPGSGWNEPFGGYNAGSACYASLADSRRRLTANDVYSEIVNVLPVSTIAWTRVF